MPGRERHCQLELDMSPGLVFKCPGCVRRAGLVYGRPCHPSTGPSTKMPVKSCAAGVAGVVVVVGFEVGFVVGFVVLSGLSLRAVVSPAFVTGGEREYKQKSKQHIQILVLFCFFIMILL